MTDLNTNTLLTHSINRSTFINILETGLRFGEYRFARRAALNWLTDFPGDLYVNYLNVKAFAAGKGNPNTALSLILQLVHKDPFFLAAYELAIEIGNDNNLPAVEFFKNGYFAAGGNTDPGKVAEWSRSLRNVRDDLRSHALDHAENELLAVIAANPPSPLAAITHIRLLDQRALSPNLGELLVRQKIIEHYYERWESCLQIRLAYAKILMDSSEPERGVEIIHNVVVDDPAGQVITRMWGDEHPYRDLWPTNLSKTINEPLPASIAAWFGLNLLTVDPASAGANLPGKKANPAGDDPFKRQGVISQVNSRPNPGEHNQPQFYSQADIDPGRTESPAVGKQEELISTTDTLNRIANRIQQSQITSTDGRFPVYVILSSSDHLAKQYGLPGYKQVLSEMQELKQAVNQKTNWAALIALIDDPKIMAGLQLKPVRAADPWAIKKSLIDLDNTLAKHGEMIGALLIIGGPQIIPFHCLPNPIDDQDFEIPSDNPYATRDENYFAPEWPVGRIPGDASSDPYPLIHAIKTAAENHKSQKNSPGFLGRLWIRIRNFFRLRNRHYRESIGYSAAIWRKASEIVYQQIGDRKNLLISPPSSTVEFRQNHRANRFAYFNLHGIQESPDWYGHKDPTDPEPGPDYPVAMRPGDIRKNNAAPLIVFSEACYGAQINGKASSESIPLSFFESGVNTFIGSTATAYGSVSTPLIAADLLGHQFWKLVNQGIPVGEALRRAKIELIRTMHERQGYLDGEDQKTLISFVLFGDPLLYPLGTRRFPKDIYRSLRQTDVFTVCDKNDEISLETIPAETLANVKQVVRQYLPSMEGATIRMNKMHAGCSIADHNCPTSQLHIKSKSTNPGMRRVVVISKRIQSSSQEFVQVARMTLDDHGKVVKLAVSR